MTDAREIARVANDYFQERAEWTQSNAKYEFDPEGELSNAKALRTGRAFSTGPRQVMATMEYETWSKAWEALAYAGQALPDSAHIEQIDEYTYRLTW